MRDRGHRVGGRLLFEQRRRAVARRLLLGVLGELGARVDDEVVYLHAATPLLLLQALERAAVVVQEEAQRCDYRLNFSKGKAEAIVSLRGRGAKEQKLKLMHDDKSKLIFLGRQNWRSRMNLRLG